MKFVTTFIVILLTMYDACCIYLPTSRYHASEPIRYIGTDVPFGVGQRFVDDDDALTVSDVTITASLKENVVNNQDSVFFFPALQENRMPWQNAFADDKKVRENGAFSPRSDWYSQPTPDLSFLSSENAVKMESNGELLMH
jgi:hypothetical protein